MGMEEFDLVSSLEESEEEFEYDFEDGGMTVSSSSFSLNLWERRGGAEKEGGNKVLKGFKFKGNDEDGGGDGLRNRGGDWFWLNGGARLAVCLVLIVAM
ncbi:hypothetical protein L195_g051030 [Trifolium pratense]|uniref:Uncharacterized protein n=1 Tax=Trifolium pratense TaxID=57577 RepID=A0A2K3JXC3_TRIPR|nr:hypothetical protein L195_g051030 [Trifolium pratense]